MYVTEDQNDAVLFTYLLKKSINGNTQPLILEGLDPDKNYRGTELNKETKGDSWFTPWDGKVFSGDYLMKYGLRFTMYNEYDSKVIRITAE